MPKTSRRGVTTVLGHPLWVVSLLLLVVNDHLLKGADVLPGLVTGKLSDVAGLLVAPALLATLFGSTRVARLASHVAVGGVFAALQLSSAFAALWDGGWSLVGIPWLTVPDPTDLVALPALLVSFTVLRPTPGPARRTPWLQAAGLTACVATSPPPGGWTTETRVSPPGEAHQLALVNDGEASLVVLLRGLRDDVVVDCGVLGVEVPGELLSEDLFDVAVAWELPPRTSIPALRDPTDIQLCHAVLVDGPELDPHVLFWKGRGTDWELDDPADPTGRSISLVSLDDLGRGIVSRLSPRVDPECAVPSALDRVDWSVLSVGATTIRSIAPGLDGCLAVQTDLDERIYVCLPEEAFPFTIGDAIDVFASPDQLVLTGDERVLTLAHFGEPIEIDGFTLDAELEADACGWRIDPECGQVTADARVVVSRGVNVEATIQPGSAVELKSSVDHHTAWVTRAEVRAVTVPDCLRPTGPIDVDLVVVTTRK